jgi:hypothetical protein
MHFALKMDSCSWWCYSSYWITMSTLVPTVCTIYLHSCHSVSLLNVLKQFGQPSPHLYYCTQVVPPVLVLEQHVFSFAESTPVPGGAIWCSWTFLCWFLRHNTNTGSAYGHCTWHIAQDPTTSISVHTCQQPYNKSTMQLDNNDSI